MGERMKVEVRKEPPSRAVLEIELPAEEVQRGVERALVRLNQRVAIPGFRRGKAPKMLLERYVGKDAVLEETVNLLVPDAYASAVDQAGVKPIARPNIHVDSLEEGQPLRFTATVDLVPEVKLNDYQAIRVPVKDAVGTDADVNAAIEDLRGRHAHLVSLGERAAEQGDYVLVKTAEVRGDQDRFVSGKEYLIEIGSGAFPAEVEDGLVGSTAGTPRTITLASGASVTFEVTDVKRRELPDLSDEFAKTAADLPTVDALRQAMRERMQREAATRAAREYEEQVIEALLQQAAIEVPASLVEHELQHMVEDLTEGLQRRGLTLQRYMEATERTEQQLFDELRPGAERRVRTQLAIEEVARQEGQQPTQEEIDREVENVARRLQLDDARIREWLGEQGRYDALVGALRRQKALAHLVKVARGEAGAV